MFKAAILPHLTYCSIVCGTFSWNANQTLEGLSGSRKGRLMVVYCDWNSSHSPVVRLLSMAVNSASIIWNVTPDYLDCDSSTLVL